MFIPVVIVVVSVMPVFISARCFYGDKHAARWPDAQAEGVRIVEINDKVVGEQEGQEKGLADVAIMTASFVPGFPFGIIAVKGTQFQRKVMVVRQNKAAANNGTVVCDVVRMFRGADEHRRAGINEGFVEWVCFFCKCGEAVRDGQDTTGEEQKGKF